MAAKLERTTTAGIFRRHRKACERAGRCDCSYMVIWRDAHGVQHTETYRTLAEAREAKRGHEADVARGEFAALARVTLHDYAREWIERYQGTGRRGFREETRHEYRGMLEKYALKYFSPRVRLGEISPRMIAEFIAWLCQRPNRRGGTLSDKSVRNAFGPLAACLATARREGLIRTNPASEAALPHRPEVEEDDERARPFPRIVDEDGGVLETLELVVALVHPEHRPMFELLAATGVRRSELLAFEGRHLDASGEHPHISVRQRARRQRGLGQVIGPLKSRHARRDLPLPPGVADRLAALGRGPREFLFQSRAGTGLDPRNLDDRVLGPACAEAGVEWAGFHTFRHTVASRLFAAGRNVVAVQRWLGHHSPSFTLDTYVHLLDGDLGEPLEPVRVNSGSTGRQELAAKPSSDASAGIR
jgi:integrase